jgi:hypothetical protein
VSLPPLSGTDALLATHGMTLRKKKSWMVTLFSFHISARSGWVESVFEKELPYPIVISEL